MIDQLFLSDILNAMIQIVILLAALFKSSNILKMQINRIKLETLLSATEYAIILEVLLLSYMMEQ